MMKVPPGEVHDLYNEGLSISEIARRLKISRASVNLLLREYELDNLKRELNEEKADLQAREANVDAREREINKIPDLEERAHFLESNVHFLNSQVDSLKKERDELEETIRSKKEVLDEIKEHEERREEVENQLSELSSRIKDLQRRSLKFEEMVKKHDEIQKQIKIKTLTLHRIEFELIKNRKENRRWVEVNKHLEEDTRVKKKAINDIKQSYYTFIDLTKQIALFMPVGSDKKTKTHEELREKVLQGMELIAKEANITKPDFESDLQALLRDPTILKRFYSRLK